MSSVRDIASQAGVSITTVSRVLNNHPRVSEQAREKVLSAANRAGYVPKVGRKSVTNIAVLYTGDRTIDSPFDANLLHGISGVMDERNFDMMVLDARRPRQRGETFTQMFMRKGIAGVIVRSSERGRELCDQILDEQFPTVVVGDQPDRDDVSVVYGASRQASRTAIEHLIQLGHERIAICINVVDDADHADRMAGYRAALEASGMKFDERLILTVPATREGGMQIIRRLRSMAEAPTAVYLTDPITCVGAFAEARRSGVNVPDELSIVGFDDADLRYMVYPPMTAVCQDVKALGREAAMALFDLMDDRSDPARRALPTWFEVHETTGPLADSINS